MSEMLRLRRGERFHAAEVIPIMFERMNRRLDDLVAEQDLEDAVEFDGAGA